MRVVADPGICMPGFFHKYPYLMVYKMPATTDSLYASFVGILSPKTSKQMNARNQFLTVGLILLTTLMVSGQKKNRSWSEVDLSEAYKLEAKVPGKVAKDLKATPVFISEYRVNQLIVQKAANHKGGGPSVFSEAALQGIDEAKYQQMVNELYNHLQSELSAAGLNMADGKALIASETAQKQHDGKKNFATVYPGGAREDRILNGAGNRQAIFRPQVPLYYTDREIPGTYYMKLASKENVNVVTATYTINFAGFDADRGFNSKSLSTFPLLGVYVMLQFTNPKGAYAVLYYKDGLIYSDKDWSTGVQEEASSNGSMWGLSSSADYAIVAKEEEFITELSGMIKAIQKDMIDALKESL